MISKKSLDIPPFLVMDVLEKAYEMEKAGQRVIHLEVGEPDFETPQCIKDACIKAIREGKTRYTHSLGLFELRGSSGKILRNKIWKRSKSASNYNHNGFFSCPFSSFFNDTGKQC